MSTTAQAIITNALRTAGLLASGQQPDPEDVQHAFGKLNDMLDAWATESLFAYATGEYVYTLPAGVATVTIGPTGNIRAATPSRIEGGYVRSSGVDHPFAVVDYAEYAGIANKATGGPFPTVGYYDGHGTLTLYPVPSGGELHVPLLLRLGEFASLTAPYTLPAGYRQALAYSLAEIVAADVGRTLSKTILNTASTSRRSLKRANHRVPTLDVPFFQGFDPIILGGDQVADVIDGGHA
jgi:hypothetical protein